MTEKRIMSEQDILLGRWMSAAMGDPDVCKEMKQDIKNWFDQFEFFDPIYGYEKAPTGDE